MNFRSLRRWFGLAVLAVSLFPLTWGYWPAQVSQRSVSLHPSDFQPPSSLSLAGGVTFAHSFVPFRSPQTALFRPIASIEGQIHPLSEIPSPSTAADPPRLELTWPERLRRGDVGRLRLMILNPAPQAINSLPTSRSLTGASYNLLVEARLEISSLVAVPSGSVAEPLQVGRPAIFFWNVRDDLSGEHPGMLWINLRFIFLGLPDGAQPQDVNRVLTAQRIHIQTQDLLGLSGPQARAFGGIGTLFGALLGLEDIVIRLLSRVILNTRADSAHRHTPPSSP